MRKRVFRYLSLYFITDSHVIQNIDAQWTPTKLYWERILIFPFARAELRKRVFLNFLGYLLTGCGAVIEYVFGIITCMMYSVKFVICTCGNTLAQLRKRVFPLYLWYLSTDLNAVFCTLFVINSIIRGGARTIMEGRSPSSAQAS